MTVAASLKARVGAALDLRRYEEAASEAKKLIAADPESVDGFGLLARAELGLGAPARALDAVERGLSKDADSEWLFRVRSLALRQLGKPEEALAAADDAVRLVPDLAHGHYARALCLIDLRRKEEAIEALERCIELDPNDATYHGSLGDLHLEKNPREAEVHYRRSLAIDPESAETLNNLGVALLHLKRPVDAATVFKSAVLVDPTLTIAKRNTHSTVERLLKGGGLIGFYIVLRIAIHATTAGSRRSPFAAIIVAVLGAIALVGFLVWRWHGARKNREELQRADPELLAIYEKLRADKKTGRL